jgi:hypothetical protein
MNLMTISLIVFACIFGGVVVGMVLRAILPKRDFSGEAEGVIKLGLGLITTMTALVLGLLVSSAKSSYDAKRSQLSQLAADAIFVDQSLALYGSETNEARSALRDLIAGSIDRIQSTGGEPLEHRSSESNDTAAFFQMVRRLSPRDEGQRSLKTEVLSVSFEVGQLRAQALARQNSSIPVPFLVVLVFWLVILFTGFGLFAPPNPTVVTALFIFALSVSTAVFMILDMDQSFSGFMGLSTEPLRTAMTVIGK